MNAVYTAGWKILADLSFELGNTKMQEYCLKQYHHFTAGLITLFDEKAGHYVSHYLTKDKFMPARANSVQSLFPILVPEIPQSHKDIILSQLIDVPRFQFRLNTTGASTPFLLCQEATQPIILCSQSI